MGLIKNDTIEKLQDLNIVKVVSEYVDLKPAGVNYKGLCPFHNDKNPSLSVSPSKNICHCFVCGEGGNPITFVRKMENCSFQEACRLLGEKYNIEIDEQVQLSEEEEALQKKRESSFIIFDAVQKYFVECLHADTPEAKEAFNYAIDRWGEEVISEFGLGYAPKSGSDIIKFVEQKGFDVGLMKELDLIRTSEKNGREYGFYFDRLMIPIRDKYGRVVSFSGRTMNATVEHGKKYINGADTFFFNKKEHLFAYNTAIKIAVRKRNLYLVEGAADVLKLCQIGVENVVASLGTALTQEQVKLLKKQDCQVCIIPDQDQPGIDAAIKNGQLAMDKGIHVKVKEIPSVKNADGLLQKQDADSYFQSIEQFESLAEEDYIIWYAKKRHTTCQTPKEESDVLKDVASLLAGMEEAEISIYLDSLIKVIPGKKTWRSAIASKRQDVKKERQKSLPVEESNTHQEYGFFIRNGVYCTMNDRGAIEEWSNFTLTPLFHVRDIIMPKRIFYIRNTAGTEELVEFRQEDLVSLIKFKLKIEGCGHYIWKAGDKELTKLKDYLYSQTETATPINQLGWQDAGFYAFGNGIYLDGTWINADDKGIVRIEGDDNYYLPAASKLYKKEKKIYAFERNFVHKNISNCVTLRKFTDLFFDVFGDNARIGFIYLLSSLFRDIIFGVRTQYPILNLFGPIGSGKTKMAEILLYFFEKKVDRPNLSNSTIASLNDKIALVSDGLVLLEEYKNDLPLEKIELLKGTYDGTGRSRVNLELDKRKEMTPVDCGIVMTGQEMPTKDIALFSRVIFLQFPKTVFTEEESKKFNELLSISKKGLTHLTLELLDNRKIIEQKFESTFDELYAEVDKKLKGNYIDNRIKENWVFPLAIFKLLQPNIDINLSLEKLLDIALNGITIQNSACRTTSEEGKFWVVVQFLYAQGDLIEGGDFKFQDDILCLQRSRIFKLYSESCRKSGVTSIPEETMNFYLRHSGAYMGEKVVKYKRYVKGHEVSSKPDGSPMFLPENITQRSYCFNYKMLCDEYGINLRAEYDIPDIVKNPPF